ncbi:MAG: hypothetical protein LC802_21440 [Acidobacteria bacterium]|nr:hypothetical protein [Acidobacteriota bacterium]
MDATDAQLPPRLGDFGTVWGYGPGGWQNDAHPDQHALAFSPTDPLTFYIGNDGGLWKTTDGGASFTSLNGTLSLSQFIGIAAHPADQGFLIGGTQDNGTQLRDSTGTGWTEFAGGDGGHPFINPVDPRAVLSTYVRGTIRRWQVNPDGSKVEKPGAAGDGTFWNEYKETGGRIAFYPPFGGNGVDQAVYFGAERLFVSRDFADTVNVDSPTWTAPGGDIDQTFVSDGTYTDVLSAIGVQRTAYSPTQVIYTGSMMGRVMVSRNGGATWADAMTNLPRGYVESITVAPSDPTGATAYLTLGAYGNLQATGTYDYYGNGHVFKTSDFGATWADLSGTNPATKLPNTPTTALLVDPSNPSVIYAGTDIGVFRSISGGNTWETFNNGLPPVPVNSFSVSASGKIQIGTYGRGAYELQTTAGLSTLQFELQLASVGEAATRATLNVTRTGDLSATVSATVRTQDNPAAVRCDDTTSLPFVAFARCDYATAVETLTFAPNETAKSFSVSIINDVFQEPDENVSIALVNPSAGAQVGPQGTTALRIVSDELLRPGARPGRLRGVEGDSGQLPRSL